MAVAPDIARRCSLAANTLILWPYTLLPSAPLPKCFMSLKGRSAFIDLAIRPELQCYPRSNRLSNNNHHTRSQETTFWLFIGEVHAISILSPVLVSQKPDSLQTFSEDSISKCSENILLRTSFHILEGSAQEKKQSIVLFNYAAYE